MITLYLEQTLSNLDRFLPLGVYDVIELYEE